VGLSEAAGGEFPIVAQDVIDPSPAALRIREVYDRQAKERQRASGGDHKEKAVVENLPQPDASRSRDAARKAVGVSGKGVLCRPSKRPAQAATAECDENTCRKVFVISEAVALGEAVEAAYKPVAEASKKKGKQTGGKTCKGRSESVAAGGRKTERPIPTLPST